MFLNCFLFYKSIIWSTDCHYLIIFSDDLNCSLTRFKELPFIPCKRVAVVFSIDFSAVVLYQGWHRYFFPQLFFIQFFEILLSEVIIIIPHVSSWLLGQSLENKSKCREMYVVTSAQFTALLLRGELLRMPVPGVKVQDSAVNSRNDLV